MTMEANRLIPSPSRKLVFGNCFKCGQPGHWMKDCDLLNSPQKRRPTELQKSDESLKYPTIMCRCGQGNCVVFFSKANPGGVYKCPQNSFRNCDYFLPCNQAGPREFNNCHLIIPFPECPCGAGLCTLTNRDNLRCFVCRVPKGQGACNFFQWYDIPPHAKIDARDNVANPTNTLPSNLDNQRNVELEQGEASGCKRTRTTEPDPVMEDGYIHLSSSGGTSGPSRTNQLEDSSCHTASGDLVPLPTSCVSKPLGETQSDIHLQQARFTAQVSNAETPPPNGLFPNSDVSVTPLPPYADAFVTKSFSFQPESPPSASKSKRSVPLSPQSPFGVARLFNKVLCDSPTPRTPPNVEPDDVITNSILKAYESAALEVQKKFLLHLEWMNPGDHETMDKEAHTVFAGLDRLNVDYSSFYERVMEYISTASSLALIECSVPRDIQSQEITERCRSKQLHLEEISRDLSAVINSLSANESRRQVLREELASREKESTSLEIRLAELYEMKSKSEHDLQAARDEAKMAEKLCEQREVERRSAVAALEKAKTQLWA